MCTYVHIHFVIVFFLLCAVGHFPKKCCNAAMPRPGKNTAVAEAVRTH